MMTKIQIISKDEIIDFQTMIEEVVSPFLAKSKIYKGYEALTEKEKESVEHVDLNKLRAYFVADSDYELILRKKERTK